MYVGSLNNMAYGFKTFIFIVAFCTHMVSTYDGCPNIFYGELFKKNNVWGNLEETEETEQTTSKKMN